MTLDIYATVCGKRVISLHAIVEANRPASVLKKKKKANTCKFCDRVSERLYCLFTC